MPPSALEAQKPTRRTLRGGGRAGPDMGPENRTARLCEDRAEGNGELASGHKKR